MRKVFLMICMSMAALAASAQTSIKVQVHNAVTLDEQFTVKFIIDNASPSDFEWSAGENFSELYGPVPGYASSVRTVNGYRTESSQVTYTYALVPVKTGKFKIPKARATVNGKDIYSSEVEIEVLAGSGGNSQNQTTATKPESSDSGQDAMLSILLSKKDVVVGEPIRAVVKLYSRSYIDAFERVTFPKFDGFWTQIVDLPTDYTFQRKVLDGQLYYTTVLREYVLIPQHAGTIEISPAEIVFHRNEPISYGIYVDYRTVRSKAASDAVKVNVKPLPTPAPDSFYGGVGTFSVTASLTNDDVVVNDVTSLMLSVSGTGNLQFLETPQVTFPQDFDNTSNDPILTNKTASDGISGVMEYEYLIIPRKSGKFEIDPIDYSYYDINSKSYVTVTIPPVEINVTEESKSDAPAGVTGSDDRFTNGNEYDVKDHDIRSLSYDTVDFKMKGDFLVRSNKFWVWVLVILACFGAAWYFIRRIYASDIDQVDVKHRKATKMALKRLRKAGDMLRKEQVAAFYEELHNALLGYVADKLNMPVSELSKDNISKVLLEKGVSETVVAELVDMLDSCEFARYAPNSENLAMTSDYEKAVDVISTIDAGMKTRKGILGKAVVAVLLMFCSFQASAYDAAKVDSLWNSANASYDEGQYAAAIADYNMISDMGLESPELYYNMGNAYFRADTLAKAVLFYERALKLDPSNADAKHNLDFVNNLIPDKKEPTPEFFVKEWLRNVSVMTDSDGWAVTFLILLTITLALVLVFLLARSAAWRKVGFFSGIAALVLMFCALSFSLWQEREYNDSDQAVVMRKVSVTSERSITSSKTLFDLPPGTKVNVLEIMGERMMVSTEDGKQGWVNSSDLEII